jgi:hypothetical protein
VYDPLEPDTSDENHPQDGDFGISARTIRLCLGLALLTAAWNVALLLISNAPTRQTANLAFGLVLPWALLTGALAIRPEGSVLDRVLRAGVTIDAFFVTWLVIAIASPALSVWAVLKLYVIAAAVALTWIGLAEAVFTASGRLTLARVIMAAAGAAVVLAAYWLPRARVAADPAYLARTHNADLFAAATSALHRSAASPPWYAAALVYAAAAGLAWSARYLARTRRPAA